MLVLRNDAAKLENIYEISNFVVEKNNTVDEKLA